MYLCLKCYEVYNDVVKYDSKKDWNCCPKSGCIGKIIEVDDSFVTIISELNKKGYSTKYCCSGHVYENTPSSYIYFEDDVDLPNLPVDYSFEPDRYQDHSIIRNNFDISKNIIELNKDILQNAINVLDWTNSLSPLNY